MTYNLWDINTDNDFNYINTIEEYEDYINNTDDSLFLEIKIKDSYNPSDSWETRLEGLCQDNNVSINFVDDEHNVALSNTFISPSIMSYAFFDKYKDRIIKCMQEKVLNSNLYNVKILNFLFDDAFFQKLTEKYKSFDFIDVELSEEQKKILQEKYIICDAINNGVITNISNKFLFEYYTQEDLKNNKIIDISNYIEDFKLDNLKYIEDDARIIINIDNMIEKHLNDKNTACYEILKMVQKLNSLNKNYNIVIKMTNRMSIYPIINELKKCNNTNVNIDVELTKYTLDEYINESNDLDNLLVGIKDTNMSPFEKYLAVYNVVKDYKQYKEKEKHSIDSRDIKYILHNEYIVCAGFDNLLRTLLERVGIETCHYGTDVSETNINEANINESLQHLGKHARTIVHMIDPKYNINGYYIADATFDNKKGDTYDYALKPIDSMQTNHYMYSLEKIDYLLDVHSFDEFNTKVNVLLSSLLKTIKEEISFQEKVLKAYNKVFDFIMLTLKELDYNKYLEYQTYSKVNVRDRNEKFYIDFLTNFGHYVVSKSNKNVPNEVIANAASNMLQIKDNVTNEEKAQYEDKVLTSLIEREQALFPYELNGNGELVDKPKAR